MRLLPLAFLLLAACDQLTSTATAVGVVTKTPNLSAASGLDPSLTTYLPLDALAHSNATVGVLILGRRDSLTSTNFTAVSNATTQLSFSGTSVGLCAGAAGSYTATSVSGSTCADTALSYAPNAIYTFDASTTADTYSVRVTAPQPIDTTDVAFNPALTAKANVNGAQLQRHDRNTALNVDWSASGTSNPAFVAMFRIDYVGATGAAYSSTSWSPASGNPVFSNLPASANDYIDLVLDDTPPTAIDIPQTAFNAQGLYLVVVTLVDVSTDSSGLSLGSGAIAGAGTAFAFWVQ